jgi:heme exporter protein D
LQVIPARSMMPLEGMTQTQLHHEMMMTENSVTAEQPTTLPPVDRGMSIGKAAIITIASAVLVALSSYAVVRGNLSAGMTRLLAVVALLSLVAMVYGLIELALAVIATTSERRRIAREVSERRQGDRARKPKH